jgi:pyruvate dehydrogenase E2 component (dihydrolipoamide acetyltransferase)
MKAVVFPKSGLITEQGTLLQWTASEGDRVEEGQLLCEVETEKTTIEVTAPVSGLLRKILVAEGGKGPVGMTLGWIGEPDEEIPEVKEVPTLPEAAAQKPTPAAGAKTRPQRTAGGGRLRASPAARKLAAESGIDLAEISGSGPGGAITTGDVERAIEAAAADADAERVPMSSMRRAIANQTQESFQQAPHFYLTLEADAELLSEGRPEGVSITHCLIRAAGLALREFPQMRAKLQGQEFLIPHAVHVGLITAVEGGLVVPVIRDADQLSLSEIADKVRALVENARAGKLSGADASGAGFSITNLGMYDVETFHAIIHTPESAILAVGTVMEKPVVKDGNVVAGKRMALTLSCDHRVVDGVIAAQFLGHLKALLEDGSELGLR